MAAETAIPTVPLMTRRDNGVDPFIRVLSSLLGRQDENSVAPFALLSLRYPRATMLLMSDQSNNKFVEATKGRNPISLLVEAVSLLGSDKGVALDLGCGAGVDVKYLADNGFEVVAIDINKEAVEETKKKCEGFSATVIQGDVADFKIEPDKYSVIMAWNTLPFLSKENARRVLIDIQIGLKKGGLFVFGMFGPEDEWAKDHPKMSFWTVDEIKELLPEMDFVKLNEIKKEGPLAVGGNKFWHKIQGIARLG